MVGDDAGPEGVYCRVDPWSWCVGNRKFNRESCGNYLHGGAVSAACQDYINDTSPFWEKRLENASSEIDHTFVQDYDFSRF